ncbi:hypothetical protein OBG91_13830 [Lactococcus lactis]|nr:hypothetical protein [Lactococcus lactis]
MVTVLVELTFFDGVVGFTLVVELEETVLSSALAVETLEDAVVFGI